MTEPTTEAGRQLRKARASDDILPYILAIEAEAREGVTLTREPGLDVERLARLHHEGGWAPGGCTQRSAAADEPWTWTEVEWFMCPKNDVHRQFGEWMYAALASEDRP